MRITNELIVRFTRNYIEQSDGCWRWIGDITCPDTDKRRIPYGRMLYNGRRYPAHRLSYLIHKGDFDQSLLVCHTCDFGLCVNPDHLFLGTKLTNMIDRDNKRRQSYGEHNGMAKLTEQQILEIRFKSDMGIRRIELAKQYGVSAANISDIALRYTWKHL